MSLGVKNGIAFLQLISRFQVCVSKVINVKSAIPEQRC